MTSEELEQRDAHRLLALRTIYESAKGSTVHLVEVGRLADHLRIDREVMLEAVRYLASERLLAFLGDETVHLTHAGVVEMEAAIRTPNRPTSHFSPTVILQTFNAPVGVGAQSGGTSRVTQHVGASLDEVSRLISEIHAALPDGAEEARELLDGLREELTKQAPKPSLLKAFGAGLWAVTKGLIEIAPKIIELLDKLKLPH